MQLMYVFFSLLETTRNCQADWIHHDLELQFSFLVHKAHGVLANGLTALRGLSCVTMLDMTTSS